MRKRKNLKLRGMGLTGWEADFDSMMEKPGSLSLTSPVIFGKLDEPL